MTDWEDYAERHQFLENEVPELLLEYMSTRDWRTFLDLGCGDGNLLYAAEKRGILKGKEVYAVDISEKRVEAVRSIFPDFNCFVEDACDLKHIASDSVDILASAQVIEHVPDDSRMIREIARVVRTNGYVYLSTVFKKPGAVYIYRNQGRTVIDPTHVREYTVDSELLKKLTDNGFVIEKNVKSQMMRAVIGFTILSKLGARRDIIQRNPVVKLLHELRFPIPGYFYWEVVARRS
jgi:2-polyprenyl-3-methyl-5-hydroxy-6-metoxy-1,4-benzoquinol methylase